MRQKGLPTQFAGLTGPKQSQPQQAWMLTFADLTGLLLSFFILFYATLVIDKPRWQSVVGSFQATFNPVVLPLPVAPTGQNNAIPVVRVQRSLLYLDNLLRQRLATDDAWRDLVGTVSLEGEAFVYPLGGPLADPLSPLAQAAWPRLGAAVRTWQTPVAVRVVVPIGGNWQAAATRAWALAQLAAKGGGRVTAEVKGGTIAATQWVLLAAD